MKLGACRVFVPMSGIETQRITIGPIRTGTDVFIRRVAITQDQARTLVESGV
jgi:hypothetical protein